MDTAFQVADLPGRIGLVTFDMPGKKVNTFSRPVLEEMAGLLDRLEQKTDWQGLLFRSGKQGQFIAGADLRELAALSEGSPEGVHQFLEIGHKLFNRWSNLPFPTVALIDGTCLEAERSSAWHSIIVWLPRPRRFESACLKQDWG